MFYAKTVNNSHFNIGRSIVRRWRNAESFPIVSRDTIIRWYWDGVELLFYYPNDLPINGY